MRDAQDVVGILTGIRAELDHLRGVSLDPDDAAQIPFVPPIWIEPVAVRPRYIFPGRREGLTNLSNGILRCEGGPGCSDPFAALAALDPAVAAVR